MEDAFRRKNTDEGPLRRFLAGCGKGVNGVTHLRAVLDERLDGRPARSGFEVIVGDILREYGVLLPERRSLVSVPPDQKFELDLAYVDKKVAIEAMGKKWHATATQRRADSYRRRVLAAAGWIIVEVWWDQAVHTPADVACPRPCRPLNRSRFFCPDLSVVATERSGQKPARGGTSARHVETPLIASGSTRGWRGDGGD